MIRHGTGVRRFNDDGRIALLVVFLAIAMLTAVGLAVDGGGKMRALKSADDIAAEAARAAGQVLNSDLAVPGVAQVVDVDRARTAARDYVSVAARTARADNHSFDVEVDPSSPLITPDPSGRLFRVTVKAVYHPRLLPIPAQPVTGQATVELLVG